MRALRQWPLQTLGAWNPHLGECRWMARALYRMARRWRSTLHLPRGQIRLKF